MEPEDPFLLTSATNMQQCVSAHLSLLPITIGSTDDESRNRSNSNEWPRTPVTELHSQLLSSNQFSLTVVDGKTSASSALSTIPKEERIRAVRTRALEIHSTLAKQKEATRLELSSKQLAAEERRHFIQLEQKVTERATLWATHLRVLSFAALCKVVIERRTQGAERRSRALDRCRLLIRRPLRRARLAIAVRGLSRPSIAQIRDDKTLSHFSDSHLLRVAEAMMPLYFFPNEAIIFSGFEGDNGYTLGSGSIEVIMGGVKVATLSSPGASFGMVGMITGEPRTATVIAKGEGCVVWSIHRSHFNQLFEAGEHQRELQIAFQHITELRLSNLLNVYKGQLDPKYLREHYASLRSADVEVLSSVVRDHSVPKIVGPHEVIVHPTKGPQQRKSPLFFLLRGTVRLLLHRSSLHQCDSPLRDSVRLAFDCPTLRSRRKGCRSSLRSSVGTSPHDNEASVRPQVVVIGQSTPLSEQLRPFAQFGPSVSAAEVDNLYFSHRFRKGEDAKVEIARIRAPALLNLGTLLFSQTQSTCSPSKLTSPLVIETATECDLLQLSRDALKGQDILSFAAMRHDVINTLSDFVIPSRLTKNKLVSCLVSSAGRRSEALAQLLAPMRSGASLPLEQWAEVHSENETLLFSAHAGLEVVVVVSGDIESCGRSFTPGNAMWPPLSMTYFGSVDLSAVVKSKRLECIRFRRRDLLHWIGSALDEEQLLRAVEYLSEEYIAQRQSPPVFSDVDLPLDDLSIEAVCRANIDYSQRALVSPVTPPLTPRDNEKPSSPQSSSKKPFTRSVHSALRPTSPPKHVNRPPSISPNLRPSNALSAKEITVSPRVGVTTQWVREGVVDQKRSGCRVPAKKAPHGASDSDVTGGMETERFQNLVRTMNSTEHGDGDARRQRSTATPSSTLSPFHRSLWEDFALS